MCFCIDSTQTNCQCFGKGELKKNEVTRPLTMALRFSSKNARAFKTAIQHLVMRLPYANKYEIYADIIPDAPDTDSIMLKIMLGLSYLSYFSTSFIFIKHALTKNDVGIVVNLGKGGVRRDAERANVEAVLFAALNI